MKLRTALAAAGLALSAGAGSALASTGEVALEQRAERINFNIGCQQTGENPTCDSTAYWLGTGVGTNSVASTFDATPLGYAFYQLDGGYTPTTFAGDDTLRDTYTLVGESVVKGQVVLSGFVSGAEVGVDSAVSVVLSGTTTNDAGRPVFVEIGSAEVTKIVSTPVDTTYAFEIQVPAALDGTVLDSLSADVAQRHVTVLQNGFMDGEGGSYFDLPYVAPVEE